MRKEGRPARASADGEDGLQSTRITIRPSFDMQQFARESHQVPNFDKEEPPTRPRSVLDSDVYDVGPSIEIDEWISEEEAEAICWARIGDGAQVPVLARPKEVLLREPRSTGDGFVLAAIDGRTPVHAVLRASGLPVAAALRSLCELVERGAVGLTPPQGEGI
jgi:hypothetical protein